MSARYYVLVSQELLDADPAPAWEDAGLHLIEQGALTQPGVRACRFLDDNAPEELEGKTVDVSFGVRNDTDGDVVTRTPFIDDRRVIA
jgi:hypothetical protein